MTLKKFLIGGFAGGLVYFFLGWVTYALFMNDFIDKNHVTGAGIYRVPAFFSYTVVGKLLFGYFMTYVFIRANINSVIAGVVMGAIVGMLMTAATDVTLYGTTLLFSIKLMIADIINFTFISAVAGGAIVMVAGMNDTTVDPYRM